MNLQYTTPVPNTFFDVLLPTLTESELKILLIVIRQTNGWIDKNTGKRKTKDRLSHGQFIAKTGLSRRVISKGIQSLISKRLLKVTDFYGRDLHDPNERKGKSFLYYAAEQPPVHKATTTYAQTAQRPMHKRAYNKTNYTKINYTKPTSPSGMVHIGTLLKKLP